jgi:PAS domain S-box-containing protein
MLGYTQEELLGKNSHAMWHYRHNDGSEYPSADCPVHKSLGTGQSYNGEDLFIRRDGSFFSVEVSSTPRFQDGAVKGAVVVFRDIEERKQNQRELTILKRSMEQSPVSTVITDTQGRIEFVNPKFSKTTGYAAEEAIGQNPRILKSGEVPSSTYQNLWETILSGKTWHGTFHNKKKNGELYWEDAIISPVMDEKSVIHHFIALKEDVTERKAQEEKLRLQSQAMDSAPGYILISDATLPDNPIMYANHAFEAMTGFSVEDVIGKNPRFLQGDDKNQEGLRKIRKGIKEKRPVQTLIRNYRKDGSLFWNDIRIAPVWSDAGKLTHYIGISNVVTELVAIQEKLKENERRLRMAQEYADIGTWDWNIKTGELVWSERIAPLFGYPDGILETSYDNFLNSVHPEDRQMVADAIQNCVETGRQYTIEHRCVWQDGQIRWLQENGNVTSDAAGNPSHMLGLVQDITERKNADIVLRASEENARKANRAKSEFLSSMSHELRTPLNAILGFGQLLELEASLSPTTIDFIQEILKAGKNLLELINEVLDLSRIESGRMDLSPESVLCDSLVDDCLNLVKPIAARQGVHVDKACPDTGLYVYADRVRLKQVLVNLLSNAIKYNRPDGWVHVSVAVQDGSLRFIVEDTGQGISPEKMPELFTPFNRLGAEGSEIEGTGIGLTISKRLVELMGGTIEAESQVGKGSRFWITLPQRAAEANSFDPELPPDSLDFVQCADAGYTVLYIEDNPANLRLMGRIFEKQSHIRLLTAHTPSLGLELAAIHLPDLVLLDLGLPEMDGYEVLRMIRESQWGHSIPVMALSARAMPADLEKGKNAGFDKYLTKPLDIPVFIEAINDALKECAPRKQGPGA